jgi:hypothetical protein
MRLKTDKLLVSAYVRHGDACSLGDTGPGFDVNRFRRSITKITWAPEDDPLTDIPRVISHAGRAHHDALDCASGHKADDYVLVARFACLQEGIDYCHAGAKSGARMLLVSRLGWQAMHWQYIPEGMAAGVQIKWPVRVVKRDGAVAR